MEQLFWKTRHLESVFVVVRSKKPTKLHNGEKNPWRRFQWLSKQKGKNWAWVQAHCICSTGVSAMLRVPTSRGNGHPQPVHRNLYSIDCTAADGAWKATVQMQSYRAPCLLQTIRSNNQQLGLSPLPVKTHGYPERRGHWAVLSRRHSACPTRQACGQVHQQWIWLDSRECDIPFGKHCKVRPAEREQLYWAPKVPER